MSTISAANISDGTDTVGTEYVVNGSAKAFCRGSSSGNITHSFNISSLTDNGVGSYAYNTTNDYASDTSVTQTATAFGGSTNTRWAQVNTSFTNASTLAVLTRNSSGSAVDTGQSATSFGELA